MSLRLSETLNWLRATSLPSPDPGLKAGGAPPGVQGPAFTQWERYTLAPLGRRTFWFSLAKGCLLAHQKWLVGRLGGSVG